MRADLPDSWVLVHAAELPPAEQAAWPQMLLPAAGAGPTPAASPAGGAPARREPEPHEHGRRGPELSEPELSEPERRGPAEERTAQADPAPGERRHVRLLLDVAAEAGAGALVTSVHLLEAGGPAAERTGVVVAETAVAAVPGRVQPLGVILAGWAPYGGDAVRSTLLLRFCEASELPRLLSGLRPPSCAASVPDAAPAPDADSAPAVPVSPDAPAPAAAGLPAAGACAAGTSAGGLAQAVLLLSAWVLRGQEVPLLRVSRSEGGRELTRRLRAELAEALALVAEESPPPDLLRTAGSTP
ncbi:hypothetical protein [Brevibacterium salitolerans]|uniref:hypothetical protein n=1 Tax=Brevibacterium salitolerans TaxID=1403566 RepID=UPI0031E40B39